jgi:hypothetical protein
MELVFLVGGAASRYLLEKLDLSAFVRNRLLRLAVPFIVGLVVVVPPQAYVRLDEAGMGDISYLRYWLTGGWFVLPFHGIWLPDPAHVWFLPYLFVYSVVAASVWKFLPARFGRLQHIVERLPVLLIVAGTMLWIGTIASYVEPKHPRTDHFVDDISGHLAFFPAFVLGFLIAKSDAFWGGLYRARVIIWPATAVLLLLQLLLFLDHRQHSFLLAQGMYGAGMLYTTLSIGMTAFTKRSSLLIYATDAVLPIYLLHQTTLVVGADFIVPYHLPLYVEFPLILAAAGLIPLIAYHFFIRDLPWVRVLFGLRAVRQNAHALLPGLSPQPKR